MNIDPAAVLALLSSLTQQIAALQAENAELRKALSELDGSPPADPTR